MYNPPHDIPRRVLYLRRDHPYCRNLIMLGAVSSAFRHVAMNAVHAHMFAFIIDKFLAIDGMWFWMLDTFCLMHLSMDCMKLPLFQRPISNVIFTGRFGAAITLVLNPRLGPVTSLLISRFVE
ncbi:hypothetical protein PHMEG_0006111 [Phytophthora megakarya]|uniref:Transmembrane protein n=1 Tax=Phytophthora megakarya TaxID=4795 RepID=A0A225WPP4_9STRA|nr:hypothetical protein PHMEG_0006111 [Phytophthora megakarya]